MAAPLITKEFAMSLSITIDNGGASQAAAQQDPISVEATARWKREPALRAEFNDDFNTFAAFERARTAGRIRIQGQPQGGRA